MAQGLLGLGGSQAGAKGGGEQGSRGWARTKAVVGEHRWRGVHGTAAKTVLPSPAAACTRQTSTARAMAARRANRGNVPARSGARKREGPKARPCLLRVACVRAGVHDCAKAALLLEHARERERTGVGTTTAGQSGGGATTPKRNKEGSADGVRALVKAAAPARKASQPGSMAGITNGGGAVVRCERRVPPRLEGRGVHRWQGKLVLTSVATGRSAGVGEERWRGLSVRRKKTAAWRRGSRGSRRARRRRVRLLPRAAPVFAANSVPTNGLRLLLPLFSFSPSSPSPVVVSTGEDSPPRRLGLGEPGGLRGGYL
jgi:hypothetical protein